MKIDAHHHFIPEAIIELMKKDGKKINTEIIIKDGKEFVSHTEGFIYPLLKGFYDYDAKMEYLEGAGFDGAVLSVPPVLFYYWLPADVATYTSELCNDGIADFVKKYPGKFWPMATVPMQDVDAAVKELERAHLKLGMNAVQIAPIIQGEYLDDPKFEKFYEVAEKYNMLICLHPYYVGAAPPYDKYYEINSIINPFTTTMGINRLIHGGMVEKYPKLKILTVHGAGYYPYQLGRFMHTYKVRPEPKEKISQSPEYYFMRNFYFDTVTHWEPSLKFLIEAFGADRVVTGTDYPFDMADLTPISKVEKLPFDSTEKKKIYSGNILELLGF